MQLETLKRLVTSPYTVTTAFFIFFVIFYLHHYFQTASSQIEFADQSYLQGERSQTVSERKADFNKALDIYLKVEEKYHPHYGNGKLYYNVGNTYFQLQEYPLAILYYYKALYLNPNMSRATYNLNAALAKLNLQPAPKSSTLQNIFFFYHAWALPVRLQIFFFLSLIALAAFSFYLWMTSWWMKVVGIVFSALAGVMLFGFAYGYLFEYSEAVVMKSVFLHRGAGQYFTNVTEEPLRAGNKIVVYQSEDEGKWLKVEDSQGNMGYIPYDTVRFVF